METAFVSIGSCTDLEEEGNKAIEAVCKILSTSEFIKYIDRDDRSQEEIEELKKKGIKCSSLRNIESYLLSDEIIQKLCISLNKEELITQCLDIKNKALAASIKRGNPSDDLKSASADIHIGIKKILTLTRTGNNRCSFLRDTMSPLITQETETYKSIFKDIFE